MFESREESVEKLMTDKDAVLEGYVVEDLFENQFLNNRISYSKNWWFVQTNVQNKVGGKFFFCLSDKLNSVDAELWKALQGNASLWQVKIQDDNFVFCNGSESYSLDEFMTNNGITPKSEDSEVDDCVKNPERQERCIEYFEAQNSLRETAIQRYFADDVLGAHVGYPLNIDFITISSRGTLCAIEVKYKYESQQNEFGINQGEFNCFKFLMSLGVEIHHFILYNEKKDKNLNIFGFLEDDEIEKYWIYKRLDEEDHGTEGIATPDTSIGGNRSQKYVGFPADRFRKYAELLAKSIRNPSRKDNDCHFEGKVVNDPQLKNVEKEDGTVYKTAKFRLLINDGNNKRTGSINIRARGKNAEYVENYVKKGTTVAVESHASPSVFADDEGKNTYYMEFVCNDIQITFERFNNVSQLPF